MGLSEKDISELSYRYYKDIYKFILRRIKNRQTSEDLTQDTFLFAQKSRRSFKNDINRRGWLFKIARNLVLNHVNREKVTHDLPEEMETEKSRDNDPFLQLVEREQEAHVKDMLDALPPRQRQCLSLYFNGLLYREIATTMKMEINTVKSTMSKARATTKEWLKGKKEPKSAREQP